MRLNVRRLALSAIALPLLIGGASFAQPAAAPPPPPPGSPMMGMHHHDPAAMAEKHAAMLRDILQLRPDQDGALRALVDSMKPPADGMGGMNHDGDHDGDHDDALTTPQRMDRMLAKMDEHRAMMVRHIEAVKRFYAQLTPAQQKAFDAVHAHGPMGHGMMDGGPPMMMMGHGAGGHGGMDHGGHGDHAPD
jgi:hypothetical protein